jgi:hypothetical protein
MGLLGKGPLCAAPQTLASLLRPQTVFDSKSEDLFSRPQAVLNDVTDFLGIERYRSANAERIYNKAPDDQRDWQIEPKMRGCLEAYFRRHNRDLYEYVGRDFGW